MLRWIDLYIVTKLFMSALLPAMFTMAALRILNNVCVNEFEKFEKDNNTF